MDRSYDDGMARRLEDNMGSDAMRAATGRTHEQWRAVLDAAGARSWEHKATAEWLVDTHGVTGWWAQGITVDYEQARKGRQPGQRADGTFSTQKARTIAGSPLEVLDAVAAVLTAEDGEPSGSNREAAMPNVRWRLADGTRLHIAVGAVRASGSPVTVTQERLPSAQAAAAAKERFSALLASV